MPQNACFISYTCIIDLSLLKNTLTRSSGLNQYFFREGFTYLRILRSISTHRCPRLFGHL